MKNEEYFYNTSNIGDWYLDRYHHFLIFIDVYIIPIFLFQASSSESLTNLIYEAGNKQSDQTLNPQSVQGWKIITEENMGRNVARRSGRGKWCGVPCIWCC